MRLYGGIDLHSNNNYIGIIDKRERRAYKKKLPNDLVEVSEYIEAHSLTQRGR